MIISRVNDQITITAEDTFDWMEIFDNGLENEILFEVDGDNLEFFFPNWESYIDQDNPFDSLRVDEVKQIKSIHILLADNLANLEGEGFYDVVECKFDLVKEYIEEDGEEPSYERFLDLVGTVHFKVTPDLPEV